jgi:hypothetical protein
MRDVEDPTEDLTDGDCQPYAPTALYARNIFWYSLMLEAE